LKRAMYGRANLNLLRRRFLPPTQSTKLGEEPLFRGQANENLIKCSFVQPVARYVAHASLLVR
jgi:hypothetical protein